MAKNYEEKKAYYIPAYVDQIQELGNYPVKVSFRIGEERCGVQFENSPALLFTAEEVAQANGLYTPLYDEVVSKNRELKAKVASLQEENDRLTAWYKEANKTASEAAEANDELKEKIAELRDEVANLKAERCSLNGQVGKNLAEIQSLSSDVHFFKEACKKQKAECDELKGRYDELDSVNKEQAEKIRKLDERNKYLESEKNRKPIVHVLTNDGHVYAFTSSGKVSVKYHTEHNILMIEDGEKAIAGFVRGDKPGNLSAWWTG